MCEKIGGIFFWGVGVKSFLGPQGGGAAAGSANTRLGPGYNPNNLWKSYTICMCILAHFYTKSTLVR
jgi:hypothetical protein